MIQLCCECSIVILSLLVLVILNPTTKLLLLLLVIVILPNWIILWVQHCDSKPRAVYQAHSGAAVSSLARLHQYIQCQSRFFPICHHEGAKYIQELLQQSHYNLEMINFDKKYELWGEKNRKGLKNVNTDPFFFRVFLRVKLRIALGKFQFLFWTIVIIKSSPKMLTFFYDSLWT